MSGLRVFLLLVAALSMLIWGIPARAKSLDEHLRDLGLEFRDPSTCDHDLPGQCEPPIRSTLRRSISEPSWNSTPPRQHPAPLRVRRQHDMAFRMAMRSRQR